MSNAFSDAQVLLTQIQLSQAQSMIAKYSLAFQVSPIILQGGIAANAQGGILPIIALYGELGLFSTATDASQFFAQYMPMPGGTLINNSVSTQPMANQQVAGNAIIQEPLTISVLMIAPVTPSNSYVTKLSTWTALQGSLQAHCAAGGTFSVATPAFVYNDLILTGMTHVATPESRQQQIEYQLDFFKPLLTLSAAQAAQQQLIAKITSGGQITGVPAWSGNLQAQSQTATGLTGALAQFGAASSPNVQSAISAAFGGS